MRSSNRQILHGMPLRVLLGTHPKISHSLTPASSRLADRFQALQNALRALSHGAYLILETMSAAQSPDSLLDLPQIVARERGEQVVLHLEVETSCRWQDTTR